MSGPGKLEMSAFVSGAWDVGPDRDKCEGREAAGSVATGVRQDDQRKAGVREGTGRRVLQRYEAEGAVELVSQRRKQALELEDRSRRSRKQFWGRFESGMWFGLSLAAEYE